MKIWQKIGFAVVLVMIASTMSFADSMAGSTFNLSYLFPDSGTTFEGPVGVVGGGTGVRFLNYEPGGIFTLSVNNSTVTANSFSGPGSPGSFSGTGFNGWVVTSTNGFSFTSVSVNAATNMALGLSWDANNIYVNWAGDSFNGNSQVVLDVNGSATPEPASLMLLGSGLIGAGSFVRRKLVR